MSGLCPRGKGLPCSFSISFTVASRATASSASGRSLGVSTCQMAQHRKAFTFSRRISACAAPLNQPDQNVSGL